MVTLKPSRANQLVNQPELTSSEALSLVRVGDREFKTDFDRWVPEYLDQHALGLCEDRARRVILEHQDEMIIEFPIAPLAFYRWCHIPGNPISLESIAIAAFQQNLDAFILELSENTVADCFAGRAGWTNDVLEAVLEMLRQGIVPKSVNQVIRQLKDRANGSIIEIREDQLVYRKQDGLDKKITIVRFSKHINTCLRRLENAAKSIQANGTT